MYRVGNENESNQEEDIDENEWMMEQNIEEDLPSEVLLKQHKYGFANTHSGLGSKFEVLTLLY